MVTSAGFVIDCLKDCIYVPADLLAVRSGRKTTWIKIPLHWSGQHFLLRINLDAEKVYHISVLDFPDTDGSGDNEVESVTAPYPHSKVMTRKDWSKLAEIVSRPVGRTVSFDVASNETVGIRGIVEGSPSIKDQKTQRKTTKVGKPKDVTPSRTKAQKGESQRPIHLSPVIPGDYLASGPWQHWEWGSDGDVTEYLENQGVTCGPAINWPTGWDLENDARCEKLIHFLEHQNPEVLHVSPEHSKDVYKSYSDSPSSAAEDRLQEGASVLSIVISAACAKQSKGRRKFIVTTPRKTCW